MKKTKTKIPEGVKTIRNAATGEVKQVKALSNCRASDGNGIDPRVVDVKLEDAVRIYSWGDELHRTTSGAIHSIEEESLK